MTSDKPDWKNICLKIMDAEAGTEGVFFDEVWELPEETKEYVIIEWEKKNGFDRKNKVWSDRSRKK